MNFFNDRVRWSGEPRVREKEARSTVWENANIIPGFRAEINPAAVAADKSSNSFASFARVFQEDPCTPS